MTESIAPHGERAAEPPRQPSLLSLRSSAATVAPKAPAPLPPQPAPVQGARRRLWFFVAVGALGAVASGVLRESTQVSPQVLCGSPGYRQSKNGEHQLWHRRALTIHIDESISSLGPGAADAVTSAFGHWLETHEHLPALTFDTGKTSLQPKRDGKNTVSYAPITAPGHERDLAVTMTYSNDATGEIVEADIVLNTLYPLGVLRARESSWRRDGSPSASASLKSAMVDEAENCGDRYDVQNLMTHEVGHFFGLGEDMTERGSTMFARIDECETHKRALSRSDSDAIGLLYAAVDPPQEAPTGPAACSYAGAPLGSGSWWAPALAVVLAAARRRRR